MIELEIWEQEQALKQYQLQYQAQRDSVSDSQWAQTAIVKISNGVGEGLEEFISEFGTRVVNELIVDTDDRRFLRTLGDAGYSALMGAIVGGVVQTADGMIKSVRSDPKTLAQQAADAAIEQIKAQNPQNKTAPANAGAKYRAERPRNVEYPTVPIINLSMQGVAAMNNDVVPEAGNALRKAVISRAKERLGLDKNSEVYIPASNVMRNGEEYVLKITRSSLNKMLSPSNGGIVAPESIAVLENIERIANNGVYFRSEGDRQGRDQIAGYDHLMTTVYIDNQPYVVDMRVRLIQQTPSSDTENVLYYFTPEEIVTVKKIDADLPTGKRRALTMSQETASTFNTTVPQAAPGVKNEYTPELGVQTGAAAQPTLAQQIDSMRQQLMKMQHKQKVDALLAAYEKNVPDLNKLDAQDLSGYDGHKEAGQYGQEGMGRIGRVDQEGSGGDTNTDGSRTVRYPVREIHDGKTVYGRTGRLNQGAALGEEPARVWAAEGVMEPIYGSVAQEEQQTAVEYGIPCFVISDEVWIRNKGDISAFAAKGQIYLRETLLEEQRGMYVAHEATHVMRQTNYQPYLEFTRRTPELLNMRTRAAQKLIEGCAKHCGIDPMSMTEQECDALYDEVNATVFGSIAVNDEVALSYVRAAFLDFDAYAAELSGLHQQFKDHRTRKNLDREIDVYWKD